MKPALCGSDPLKLRKSKKTRRDNPVSSFKLEAFFHLTEQIKDLVRSVTIVSVYDPHVPKL